MTRIPDLAEFQPVPEHSPSTGRGFGPPPEHPPDSLYTVGPVGPVVLSDKSMTWLLVGIVGLFYGLGIISGPLCWYYGDDLRGRYRAHGLDASAAANWAYGIGVVSTLIAYPIGLLLLLSAAGLVYLF